MLSLRGGEGFSNIMTSTLIVERVFEIKRRTYKENGKSGPVLHRIVLIFNFSFNFERLKGEISI